MDPNSIIGSELGKLATSDSHVSSQEIDNAGGAVFFAGLIAGAIKIALIIGTIKLFAPSCKCKKEDWSELNSSK